MSYDHDLLTGYRPPGLLSDLLLVLLTAVLMLAATLATLRMEARPPAVEPIVAADVRGAEPRDIGQQ